MTPKEFMALTYVQFQALELEMERCPTTSARPSIQ